MIKFSKHDQGAFEWCSFLSRYWLKFRRSTTNPLYPPYFGEIIKFEDKFSFCERSKVRPNPPSFLYRKVLQVCACVGGGGLGMKLNLQGTGNFNILGCYFFTVNNHPHCIRVCRKSFSNVYFKGSCNMALSTSFLYEFQICGHFFRCFLWVLVQNVFRRRPSPLPLSIIKLRYNSSNVN